MTSVSGACASSAPQPGPDIPDIRTCIPVGSARTWIDFEPVVLLVPKVHRDGTHHILQVEIKLVGRPAFDAWLGKFDSRSEADTRWGEFLRDLGNQVPAEG
ncbi:hypothetical protein [Herbiconiux sp. UC225_62]|uniref:hypothetical protein n=1 Tax=Herbiconiux sp. UC225_62 TaxID=3350168 RepID=UPI0036D23AFE